MLIAEPGKANKGWWAFALALMIFSPYAMVLWGDLPTETRMRAAGELSVLITSLTLVGAGTLLMAAWRIDRSHPAAGLSAACIALAAQDVPYTVMALQGEGLLAYNARWTYGHVVVVLIALLFVARAAGHGPVARWNPVVSGALVGAAIVGVRLALDVNGRAGLLDPGIVPGQAALVLILAIVAASVVISLRATTMSRSQRLLLAAALVVGAMTRTVATVADVGNPQWWVVLGKGTATVLVTFLAATILRKAIADHWRLMTQLADGAASVQADLEHSREVSHEVTATVAGVVAATHLLVSETADAQEPRRDELRRMVTTEMDRLGRMLAGTDREDPRPFDLDEVIAPVVLSQRAQGHEVDWQPGGHRAVGCRDEFAEVVTILLGNASRHGGGQETRLTTSVEGSSVLVRVSDRGPGVREDLVGSLFQRGVSRTPRPGHGIGLELARRLMRTAGGELAIEYREPSDGACFVATLPVECSDAMASAVASEPEVPEIHPDPPAEPERHRLSVRSALLARSA